MESDSDSDSEYTPQNTKETSQQLTLNQLSDKSRKKYEVSYQQFLDWRTSVKANSFSENVLLGYFSKLAETKKSSTLWSNYSTLRTKISVHNNIDISNYPKLKAFLKKKSDGYRPKRSNIFTSKDIKRFLDEAPDDKYLLTKVVMLTGIIGACRRHELNNMKTEQFNYLDKSVLVTVPDLKLKTSRQFVITEKFYEIFQKYKKTQPPNSVWFFLNYHDGKCTIQKVGINKLGGMPKQIATFLKLPNPTSYTGHCFRTTSDTILIDASGDIISKRHEEWKSTLIVEGSIQQSIDDNKLIPLTPNKVEQKTHRIYHKFINPEQNISSTSSTFIDESNESTQFGEDNINTMTNIKKNSSPVIINHNDSTRSIVFNNCSNFTINFIRKS